MSEDLQHPAKNSRIDDNSVVSSDLKPDRLRQAAEFMSTVRQRQRESGKQLSGRKCLSSDTLGRLTETSHTSKMLDNLANTPTPALPASVQRHVFETFEEMCRRRLMRVPAELRPAIYRLLAIELVINSHILDESPNQIVSATVCNGSLHKLRDSYGAEFAAKSIFRAAATGYPSDPEKFLQKVRETLARLKQDERFTNLRDMPSVFVTAAVSHQLEPDTFLLGVQKTAARLTQDQRFAELRETPSLFLYAAINYRSNPDQFLLGVQKTVARLTQDQRFAELRETPGVIRRAAVSCPTNPEAFLMKMLGQEHLQSLDIDDDGREKTPPRNPPNR